jgi:hypothetical protein
VQPIKISVMRLQRQHAHIASDRAATAAMPPQGSLATSLLFYGIKIGDARHSQSFGIQG